ncbi:MAG: preprotein translocase subunit SecA [Clostridia bacterium]|nr:preprotein translocase subunit SecA [Clostridia bacterium]
MGLFQKMFGTSSEREIKRINSTVDRVFSYEEEYSALSDAELADKTVSFKQRLAAGESLDDILPEAYAVVREAVWRVLGLKAFRVQIIGAVILHQGRIAEMKTGEGKTMTAVFPSYLNALTGEGVHVVTVNEYLAKYQGEQMGLVHKFLGLSVGVILHDMEPAERKVAYGADITYATNNELGFDYLRDNMVLYKEHMVQRGHAYAIVDEVDSILIDEARTPLIISGMGDESTKLYDMADAFAARLKCVKVKEVDNKEDSDELYDGDYLVDEKAKTVTLTAQGVKKAEQAFHIENLTDPENSTLAHHINQAIRARGIMVRDVDYVVRDGQVIIVDEFTGRLMIGRRYSDGLHQAIEAKEKVKVERESKTLATVTFQNFFRMYRKLSGMTGTAMTEADEFRHIYNLDVVEIPTNLPMIRKDHSDCVYKTEVGKFRAVIEQIVACHEKGQPVLVGTVSIDKSELLSALLKKRGIKHEVLNAKHHEKEALIVAQAGKKGAVTIATNMAGRGTDIMLGGNADYLAKAALEKKGTPPELIYEATSLVATDDPEIIAVRNEYKELYAKFKAQTSVEAREVAEVGGLFIIGTERHESRRIDNQLRGRSGRQGDPGESRFYISLQDDLMRLFGSDRIMGMMETLGVDENTPIDSKMLTGAIESAQRRIESRNFQTRKTVLEYDDVMNVQRDMIYTQRRKVLDGENMRDNIVGMIRSSVIKTVDSVCGENNGELESWQIAEIKEKLEGSYLPVGFFESILKPHTLGRERLSDMILEAVMAEYARKEAELGERIREFERVILLRNVDEKWMDHIDAMQELRQGIGLRAYGQVDPVIAYKKEGMDMFEEMNEAIRDDTARIMMTFRLRREEDGPQRKAVAKATATSHSDGSEVKRRPVVRKTQKPGRNDPCPCGSGKKYKKCCGLNENEKSE